MLEYWYKEKQTRVDFRPGPLCPYFDGFAARLKDRRRSAGVTQEILALGWALDSGLWTRDPRPLVRLQIS